MTARQYERWSAPFRGKGAGRALNLFNRAATGLCYAAYPVALLALLLRRDERGIPALLVPAVSFLLVSVFRSRYNAPRPYEVLEIDPLIHKNTRGHSFPSRHVFSMFVIAMTFLWLWPPLGAIFLLLGALLAVCRVVGGVHFPRDVLAGAAMGVAAGLCYWMFW
ncbi:MAG TPA: phosphatase PAP2 family protein [Candidatus Onthomonas avicola]|nr:phosphatase PAP2 family protein [Candidatus Onthomonas avicola]